jgi:aspartate-semialdehyde dehydrogenase
LQEAPGVIFYDNPGEKQYPMPILAEGRDEVWVGRLRKDESRDHCWNMFVVADNLRKGAATNAVQIAEHLMKRGILKTEMRGSLVEH